MDAKKININKTLTLFLFCHLFVWTFIPSISNENLPLDTIEALAWSSNLDWGYSKHPPVSAFAVEIFYRIFGSLDWVYYLLSQLFVISAFFIVFKFSEDFFKSKIHSLISILLLEGIYFFNFTTPEFNVNVCQLPFWALTVYYCWEGIKNNNYTNWLLFGFFAALGILSKYIFIYLLLSIDIFILYLIIKKKFNFKCLISLITFFAVLVPHIIWLVDNNFITINYALHRAGTEDTNFFVGHLFYPLLFLVKQIGIFIPFLILFFFITLKLKKKLNFKDKKLIFLITINIIPLALMFLTSLVIGAQIRTMWMVPFYLFSGVLFVYIYKEKIFLNKLKNFFLLFLILFIFSPATYFYISISQTDKRTDYPGAKIAKAVQEKWDSNFSDTIKLVGGDEWHGGNLSYHLNSRPKWDNILDSKKNSSLSNINDGFVLIGNVDILSEICSGIFMKKENQGICLIGNKK